MNSETWRKTAANGGYNLAARRSPSRVWVDLGVRYEEGDGMEQDEQEAARWFLKAAQEEDPDAQFRLGMLYAEGRGVPRNATEARYWLAKSADQGNLAARTALKRLGAR